MKKIFIVFSIVFFITGFAYAQNNWVSLNNSKGNFSFKLPSHPQRYDTLNMNIYIYSSEDTTLSLQAFFVDSASLAENPEFSSLFSISADEDTLVSIVKIMLYLTEGELVSIKKIPAKGPSGISGIEAGVKYRQNEQVTTFTFMQMYYRYGRYIVFAGSTNQDKLTMNMPSINQFLASVKVNN